MIKHLLLGIDGSEIARNASNLAFWVSDLWGAKVDALHVVDTTHLKAEYMADIAGSMGFEPFGNYAAQEEKILSDLGDLIVQNFIDFCERFSVSCSVSSVIGTVGTSLLEASRKVDLLILGRKGVNAAFHPDRMGSTAEYILRRTSRPLIIVPDRASPPEKFIVAYDGSDSSYKALSHAARFGEKLNVPLTVVHAGEDDRQAPDILKGASSYLEPYHLEIQAEFLKGPVEESLVEFIADQPSSMLFLGLRGHSRIRELLLGSTAEFVVNRTQIPVYCVP
ncbi:MAG TPA: universal stress protein [Thermoanaerobaculia bacterium]|nr:universal stress protein [Thermoanaerobaculia bacterium]HUM29014.1 universal stress protein [Thermoanaerobaculia bacterium]HXK67430.1 universal stress protein [Thermoanaerobaculia bacterium]